MKKIMMYGLLSIFFSTSCVNDLDEDYNVDPKKPTVVPAVTLVSNAQFNLSNIIITADYNYNPFRYYLQYWAATLYPDESQYNINTRQINKGFWDVLFRDVLGDLREAKAMIEEDNDLAEGMKKNQLASIEVLEVYAWSVLVNTFGNVPYSQALDIENVQAEYEDDAAIYDDLLTRLDAAIIAFKENEDARGLGSSDLYYGGNIENWIGFANSLKLRLGLTIVDANGVKAKAIVEAAAPHVFTSIDDDTKLVYSGSSPTSNPNFDILRKRNDNIGASTFVDVLNELDDPRLDDYFNPAPDGANKDLFIGGDYGDLNSYSSFAQPGDIMREPRTPGVLLSYTEVEFLLTEAKLRGFDVSGTAEEHYNAAVLSSIVNDWGGTVAEAEAYLSNPDVMLDPANWQRSLGIQKWIALYNQPVEGWKEWRRLDYPELEKPALAQSEMPLRFPYPFSEQNLNSKNYQAAATAMGGDVVTSRVFWDVD